MSFVDKLEDELNVSVTENGALGYKTTKKEIVDFSFKVPSYRRKTEEEIVLDFKRVWNEDKELAYKYLFYVRDVRGGLGERRLFRTILKSLVEYLDDSVFNYVLEYGRADDLYIFKGTKLEDDLILFIKKQLLEDKLNMENGRPISLLAKWLKSINASNRETKELGLWLCDKLGFTKKGYRQLLSQMRAYIDVVERKLCANEWDKVKYESVPSNANLKYKGAFLRHDEQRRREYLESLSKGKTKINSSTLFPHDIVTKYYDHCVWSRKINKKDEALEELWKALPDYVKGNSNIMVVRDGSGSMTDKINNSTSALDVATALSIYFSERCKGQFKDKFITFSSRPEFVDLSKYDTLRDKLAYCDEFNDCSNTNLEATFDLVLDVAIKNNLKQEEIPNLLIVSDMEFDNCTYGYRKTLLKDIKQKWKAFGYELPKLIFWNVNSRTNTIPLTENENGVILVSGFSAAITKIVLSEKLDPYEALVEELNNERYKDIKLNK